MDHPQQGTPPAPTEWPIPQGSALRGLTSFGTILNHAFAMPWRHAKTLLVWAVLVPAAAMFVPYEMLTAAMAGIADSAEFGSRENPFADLGLSIVTLIAANIYMFASLAATAFPTIFVVEHIRARFLGCQPSARDIWAMIRRVVWRFLGYVILLSIGFMIGIFILAIFGGMVVGIASMAASSSSTGPTVILFATIIVLAFTALIVWPLVRLAFVPAVMVFEGSSATAAMSRSWRLSKGRGWRTFGAMFIVTMACALVSIVITVLAEGVSAGALTDLSGATLDTFTSAPTFSVATVLGNAITFPLTMLSRVGIAIVATLIYLDARTQTERLDTTVEHWHRCRGQGYQPQQLAYPFAAPMAAPPAQPLASQAPPALPFAPPALPFAPPALGQQGEAPDQQGEAPDQQPPFTGQS